MKYVGTCGITAVVYNDRVYIGNAGDSQAIFILGEGGGLIRSQRANNRLSVNNKAERERIMKEWAGVDD
jgi:serine/threonine protein phosphatase PrpC